MPSSAPWRSLLLVLVLWVSAQPAAAQDAPQAVPQAVPQASKDPDWVELPAGRVYDVLVDGPKAAVWIPFKRRSSAASVDLHLPPRPLDVAVGNRHDLTLVQAFSARLHVDATAGVTATATETATGSTASAAASRLASGIELQVDTQALPGPGAYDVTLGLQSTSGNDQQTLRIQVSVPAAVLRSKSALVVERVLPWWGGDAQVVSHPLVLAETGQKSFALLGEGVSVVTDSPQVATVDGRVQIPAQQAVRRGGMATLQVQTQGDFPLGSVKGTLELQSAQLTAPAVVPFEVRTRRDRALIILLAGLGLLLGLLTRTVLGTRIAIGEQLVKLDGLHERIAAEAAQQADSTTQKKLEGLLRSLDEVRGASDPQQIAAQVAEAEGKRRDLLRDLEAARASVETRLQALQKLLSESRSLPPVVRRVLDSGSEAAQAALRQLQAGDVTGAGAQVDQAGDAVRRDLLAALRPWHERVSTELQVWREQTWPLRAREQESLNQGLAALGSRAEQLATSLDQPDTELPRLLLQTHQLHTLLLRTATWLAGTLGQLPARAKDTLSSLSLPTGAALQAVPSLDPPPADADGLQQLHRLREAVRLLVSGLNECLRSITSLPMMNDDRRRELADLQGKQDYSEALAKAVSWQQQEQATRAAADLAPLGILRSAAVVAETAAAGAVRDSLLPTDLFDDAWPGAAQPVRAVAGAAAASAEQAADRASRRRWLSGMKGLQMALSGLGITAVAYLLFESRFVGTAPELFTLFFWGFAVDISVDSLVTFSKSIRRPDGPGNALPAVAGGPLGTAGSP